MLRAAVGEVLDLCRRDRVARFFGIALIGTNIAVMFAAFTWDALHRLGYSDRPLSKAYSIMSDNSYPEMLNYVQTGLCAVLLLLIWRRTRVHIYLFWAAAFGFVLLDDALTYHEFVGHSLADHVGAIPTLRTIDTGEILAWLVAGAVLAILFFLALRQKASRNERQGVLFLALFGCLVVFAVGFDMLSIATDRRVVNYIEDGGEMLVLATACSVAFVLFRQHSFAAGDRHPLQPERRPARRDARAAVEKAKESSADGRHLVE